MSILGIILIGLIVGLIARFLKPGNDSMGWIMTILLGIGGSIAATYGGQALGIYRVGECARCQGRHQRAPRARMLGLAQAGCGEIHQ